MVVRKLPHLVLVYHRNARAVRPVEIQARRSRGIREGIVKSGRVRREDRIMRTFFLGDACESIPTETNAIQMTLEVRFFRRREIHRALRFFYRIECSDFPFSFGELRKLLAVAIVEIQVPVSGAFAGPEKALAILKEMKIVADIDPVGITLGERGSCLARSGIRNQ